MIFYPIDVDYLRDDRTTKTMHDHTWPKSLNSLMQICPSPIIHGLAIHKIPCIFIDDQGCVIHIFIQKFPIDFISENSKTDIYEPSPNCYR